MNVLDARTIAVVGASERSGNVGSRFVRALDANHFDGDVLVVHPSATSVLGHPAVPRLTGLASPDLVIVAVAHDRVEAAVRDAAGAAAHVVQVFTGGFGELNTEAGRADEQALVDAARNGDARLLGPNCMGIHRPSRGWSFRHDLPVSAGRIGVVSQSGGVAIAAIRYGAACGAGLSAAISMGNAADLSIADGVRWLLEDPETDEIAVYLESGGTHDLAEVLMRAAREKPVRLWRAGTYDASARAAVMHTGARGGPPTLDAESLGVDECHDLVGLVSGRRRSVWAVPQRGATPEQSKSVAAMSISGGFCVILAERLAAAGHRLLPLADATSEHIWRLAAPLAGNVTNPVDLGGSYLSRGRVPEIIAAVCADDSAPHLVFHVAIDYVDEVGERQPGFVESWIELVASALGAAATRCSAIIWPESVSESELTARAALERHGVFVTTSIDDLLARIATTDGSGGIHDPRLEHG